MKKAFVLAIAIAIFTLMASVAFTSEDAYDLGGVYNISGWDPGSNPDNPPDYWGEATLKRVGNAWQYRGGMDGMTYAGAGLYDMECKALSLSFTNGDGSERGVTLLHRMGNRLVGQWVMDNGQHGKIGTEIWTKKK